MHTINSLVPNPYYQPEATSAATAEPHFPSFKSLTRMQRIIFYEYVNKKTVIGSRSAAMDVILGEDAPARLARLQKLPEGKYQLVPATEADVQAAYNVGPGAGGNYEWPYE